MRVAHGRHGAEASTPAAVGVCAGGRAVSGVGPGARRRGGRGWVSSGQARLELRRRVGSCLLISHSASPCHVSGVALLLPFARTTWQHGQSGQMARWQAPGPKADKDGNAETLGTTQAPRAAIRCAVRSCGEPFRVVVFNCNIHLAGLLIVDVLIEPTVCARTLSSTGSLQLAGSVSENPPSH